MSYVTVGGPSSVLGRLAILFLFLYPFGVLLLAAYRAGRGGPMASSVVPMTLAPIFVGMAAAWLELAHVLHGLSIRGGNRAATAAGMAESVMITTFAFAVAALVAAIAWLSDVIRAKRDHEQPEPGSQRTKVVGAALVALALAGIAAQFIVERQLVATAIGPGSRAVEGVAGLLLLGGVDSLGWLLLSRRNAALRFYDRRRTLALCCALTAIALCYGGWRLAKSFMAIAISGS